MMSTHRSRQTLLQRLCFACLALSLVACATRTVNPRIDESINHGDPFGLLGQEAHDKKTIAVLAFSGGGTGAAAFSYGVLETLRDIEVKNGQGETARLLDAVDVITGVSGGSFTALAYRLHGDRLFDIYEQAFLKRDIQGELIAGVFNPSNWGDLLSDGWGRSEMAANLYDEVLFKGATFGDLKKTPGPLIVVSATDIQSGTRIQFSPHDFSILCTDLNQFRLARAAAASSAVPVILSPLTINNYAGTCGLEAPEWVTYYRGMKHPPRAALKTLDRIQALNRLNAANNPYLHLVDGGISDNLGVRGGLDLLNLLEALRDAGHKTRLDGIENIVVFVVNSLSDPKLGWNKRENGPGAIDLMIQAAGVPIDHYSSEQINELEDIAARWHNVNAIKKTPEFQKLLKMRPELDAAKRMDLTPNARVYVINVAFSELQDPDERAYLNNLPTSFVLAPEQVDRLRSSAKAIILNSTEFQRLMRDLSLNIIPQTGQKTGAAEPDR